MQIKKLLIKETITDDVIREIQFNSTGLNLIVDNTELNSEESGNSVGKSTVIHIIDLCLGGKSTKSLYYDNDTLSENTKIKDYLIDKKVQAELIITNGSIDYSLKRDLFPKGQCYFNDKSYNRTDYCKQLKEIIFETNQEKPTFRELIPKFVRVSNASEESIIKYLVNVTSKETYDAIYSFLFGILENALISEKEKYNQELRKRLKEIDVLHKNKNITSINSIKQKLTALDYELEIYIKQREELSFLDNYKDDWEKVRNINLKIDQLEKQGQLLLFEIDTINESLTEISQSHNSYNTEIMEDIYAEANSFIPTLNKTFLEMVEFHNAMVKNRINLLKNQLLDKENKLKNVNESIGNLVNEKRFHLNSSLEAGLFDELSEMNTKIEDLSLQKGELTNALKILDEQEKSIEQLNSKINQIDNLRDFKLVNKKITIFNKYFSKFCELLYGEKYVLTFNENWKDNKGFPISIDTIDGNIGTGKKKSLIVAFDLAYMEFANEVNLSVPNFVIHDKLENTHINQLIGITNISKKIRGQYILPILRERISSIDDEYISRSIILELSEKEKFFKV